MQFKTFVVPRLDVASCPELFLCAPRNIIDDARDELSPSVGDEVDAMRRRGILKEGQEERVGVGCLGCGDVFLVEHVVQQRCQFDHEHIGVLCWLGRRDEAGEVQSGFSDALY